MLAPMMPAPATTTRSRRGAWNAERRTPDSATPAINCSHVRRAMLLPMAAGCSTPAEARSKAAQSTSLNSAERCSTTRVYQHTGVSFRPSARAQSDGRAHQLLREPLAAQHRIDLGVQQRGPAVGHLVGELAHFPALLPEHEALLVGQVDDGERGVGHPSSVEHGAAPGKLGRAGGQGFGAAAA